MKITYSFSSLKDLSDVSNGERLLKILSLNGLTIDKAGGHEPIREEFCTSNLPELWKGVRTEGRCSSNDFLFKGKKEIRFSGMATWNINLHPNNRAFNGIYLWLNTPSNYNLSRLVQLGDDIFDWSKAVYGYITEDSKDPYHGNINDMPGNIHEGLPGLMWINYFGPTYIMEPDFHIPNDHVPINHGVRLSLAETPNDERLSEPIFIQSYKNKMGDEWFWHKPRKHNIKVPFFDKSAITRR